MSAAKFTQEPWEIGSPCGSLEPDSVKQYKGKPYREYPAVDSRRPDGTLKGVAHVYQGEGGVGSPQALQEQYANAQLIAAAPDLLAALKALTKQAAKEIDQSATQDGLKNCRLLAEARGAITKAEPTKEPTT